MASKGSTSTRRTRRNLDDEDDDMEHETREDDAEQKSTSAPSGSAQSLSERRKQAVLAKQEVCAGVVAKYVCISNCECTVCDCCCS